MPLLSGVMMLLLFGHRQVFCFTLFIEFHLLVHKSNHFIHRGFQWRAKVLWSIVICLNHTFKRLFHKRLSSFSILHEIKDNHVIKVCMNLVQIVEVKAIVKFRKFKYHVHHLRLICAVEAAMFLSIENSLAALKNKVRTNWVSFLV
jgi:hypothetical protein